MCVCGAMFGDKWSFHGFESGGHDKYAGRGGVVSSWKSDNRVGRRLLRLGIAAADATCSAPTRYCYGKTLGRRKREQAPALHRIEPARRLECGGLPPLSRAHQRRGAEAIVP